ncbi:hypothetical protein [Aestuariibacter salexigens]|uniref:hypothetical protein n=1 Tax=Aestuariibacter salexigens TaxID=226010 RepID=UPI00040E3CFC|nr:hypothetical protein [Aestuariibacter salexigens]
MDKIVTPHFTLRRENDVLVAIISGQWDDMTTNSYADAFKKVASCMASQPWAHITYLDRWELATPDCVPIINELERWCMANKLTCDAVVYPDDGLKDFILSKALETSRNPKVYRHFTDASDALEWISEKGFSPISSTLSSVKSA